MEIMAKYLKGLSPSYIFWMQTKFYFSNGDFITEKNGLINCRWWITDHFNLSSDNSQFYFPDECESLKAGDHDNVSAMLRTWLIPWKESC